MVPEPCEATGTHRHAEQVVWDDWVPQERAVLCFVRDDSLLLLIRKKRGLGAGKINGPGGRVQPGETAAVAAVRETREETGICPRAVRRAGELSFDFCDGYSLHCTVFVSTAHSGRMHETAEAIPFWCPVDRIPFDQMWEDDALWFPGLLAGEFFRGFFVFDGDSMLSHRLLMGPSAQSVE